MKRFRKGQKLWRLFESRDSPVPVEFERYESDKYAYVRIGDRVYDVEVEYLYLTYDAAISELIRRLRINIPSYWKEQGWK